jgi:2-C-methyl-D-erythritol 4-phosphate cytidylyltransferase
LLPDVGVVIVAAGQGTRLGGGTPKQYRLLAGVPLLLRAVRPFVAHPATAHTVVVLPPNDLAAPPAWLVSLAGGRMSLAPGGPERADSVAAGLLALPAGCDIVLVHDAARPLVDRMTIDAVIAAARAGRVGVPAIPVTDTVKETAGPEPGPVVRTVSRQGLWLAQTPQGFPRAVLERAHREARPQAGSATDDALLAERLGCEVVTVPGSTRNLKVTTEDDWAILEAILKMEGGA